MALLDELGAYLQTAGIGQLSQTLFKGSLPLDSPATTDDAIVALIEVPGSPALRSHDQPPSRIGQPHVQIVSRGAPYGYVAARQKAHDAWMALDGLANQVLSGTKYLMITALQEPWLMRIDSEHRPHLVFTVRIQREA